MNSSYSSGTALLDVMSGVAPRDATNRKNMILLIQLRWIAVIGQIVTIAVVKLTLGIALPMAAMSVVLVALAGLNLASLGWFKNRLEATNRELFVALMLDVAALSAQLYLSGGDTNPFTFLYLLQVTLAAILLDFISTAAVAVTACVGFAALTTYYRPLVLPEAFGATLFRLHIIGMFVCFVLDAGLLVVFTTRITHNLRERDARLAALRQQAAEHDHIVRMGLLASGAAHELGTPLSSLSVILNDWRRMQSLAAFPLMLEEVDEMQDAVKRCKAIVTGILLSAGEARGDAPTITTVYALLDEIVEEWRVRRAARSLTFDNRFGPDLPIVSDTALKQSIFNVLDNAFEASNESVLLRILRRGNDLILQVSDDGPGFTRTMLEQIGKPYHSSKGRLGGGLGLFLVVNVVRKLGGRVEARNRPSGGAQVTIVLPLDTLAIEANNDGE